MIACMMQDNSDPDVFDLTDARDFYDADIVIHVVPVVNATVCGVAPQQMFNRPQISANNRPFGYMAVGVSCNIPGTFFTVSHEVAHLLSIEHRIGDDERDMPVKHNHAYTFPNSALKYMTAGGQSADCGVVGCSIMVNQLSDPTGSFPNGASLGTTSDNNANRVVREQSWGAVAAYRPLPSRCA